MKLTTKARNDIAPKNFALSGGKYPIEDASHARNAKVKAKFPGIGKPAKSDLFSRLTGK